MNKKKTKTEIPYKRSKNELVKATLGSYLKRRNYTVSHACYDAQIRSDMSRLETTLCSGINHYFQ